MILKTGMNENRLARIFMHLILQRRADVPTYEAGY